MDLYQRLKAIKEAQKNRADSQADNNSGAANADGPRTDGNLLAKFAPSSNAQHGSGAESSNSPAKPGAVASDPAEDAPTSRAEGLGDSPGAGAWVPLGPMAWKRRSLLWLDAPRLTASAEPMSKSLDQAIRPELWPNGGAHRRNCLYYDSETTGLSSGSGTLMFLFGLGRWIDSDSQANFELTQWFLSDFPGEGEYLADIKQTLELGDEVSRRHGGVPLMISYNGRSFDWPLLSSRFLMNGLFPPEHQQLDLLYPARRLYGGRFADCKLSTLEAQVLKVQRQLDIDSGLIPQLYFRFLKEVAPGSPDAMTEMSSVIGHHASDISSLALLHLRFEKLLSSPLDAHFGPDAPSPGGMARQLVSAGFASSAVDLLNHAGETMRDFLLLGTLLRRSKQYDAAHLAWQRAWELGAGHKALLPMLVHWEHRCGEFQTALDAIERFMQEIGDFDNWEEHAMPDVPRAIIENLQLRRRRIEEKLAHRFRSARQS